MAEPDIKLNINLVCDTCNNKLEQPILEKSLTKSNGDTEQLVMRVKPCENCPSAGLTIQLNVNNEKVDIEC